ncbi:MAG: YihY/virulence factor BrkB family protein [Chloroflexi bacterium]|nr:YihY/virulence factor BrkB family protein [Chloroflexota bacterium]
MDVSDLLNRFKGSPVGQFFQKYGRDETPVYATLIAFNAIMAMFPIMLALLAIVGIFVRDERTLQTVSETIIRVLPSGAEDEALRIIQASRAETGLFGLVSFVGLLWGGSGMFGAMADSFNRAFAVAGRGFIGQKLMAFVMVFVFALLLVLSLATTSLATLFWSFSGEVLSTLSWGFNWLQSVAAWLVSLALSFLMFVSIYWIVPNRSFHFRQVWPGAVLSALLFFLIQQVWPIYATTLGHFGRFGAIFGLFFLLMTWFYFLAQIVVIGAELNAFLLERRRSP